jgi:hypothetical protein
MRKCSRFFFEKNLVLVCYLVSLIFDSNGAQRRENRKLTLVKSFLTRDSSSFVVGMTRCLQLALPHYAQNFGW